MSTTVIVSGANGYIAQHIVKQLIEKNYTVVGTVRTEEKGEQLKKNVASDNFSYEVIGQIEKKGAFDELLKKHTKATVFLHTASPVNFTVTEFAKDMLTPAIDGTKNVLEAIKAHGPQIQRLVVTSSAAALLNPFQTEKVVLDEKSWNPITWEQSLENVTLAYFGSKTFAERAAWDFIENEKPKFSLSVINPVYVFGPQAYDLTAKGQLNFSAEIINGLLKLEPDSQVTDLSGQYIDVRDVARAHLIAFEQENTKNERLILSNGNYTAQSVLNIIRKNFALLRKRLPVGDENNEVYSLDYEIDNDKSRNILGFELIDITKSTVDTVEQIVKVNGL